MADRLLVNLGCGQRLHPDWANYDLFSTRPEVKEANFIKGIPLPGDSADVVYHSHVLEHLHLDDAKRFLGDCHRVLKPGGILRVVLPNFEQSCRDYIAILDRRAAGEDLPFENEWMITELLDQTVRRTRGGNFTDMVQAAAGNPSRIAFLKSRLGSIGQRLDVDAPPERATYGRFEKIQKFLRKFGFVGNSVATGMLDLQGIRHFWMYDFYFLSDLLKRIGFRETARRDASTSAIADWARYGLDVNPDGTPHKGISLYVEATK